ncbi:hypothetical protein [Teredinibacter waterburyi]|uniref:hypothetical protein n=1 Tax=Teredinibacter waterburyi TaxID=1500538 RepID=UPI00165F4EF1|nr:hypothetical protein [Teredinibacter waterburyi]
MTSLFPPPSEPIDTNTSSLLALHKLKTRLRAHLGETPIDADTLDEVWDDLYGLQLTLSSGNDLNLQQLIDLLQRCVLQLRSGNNSQRQQGFKHMIFAVSTMMENLDPAHAENATSLCDAALTLWSWMDRTN